MRTTLTAFLATALCAVAQAQSPQLSEQVFKNIQVLKGIPVSEFMETMGFFSASLGVNCTYCHVQEAGGNWAKYADDNAHKQMARRMVLMMQSMNKANFGGRRALTCYSCHRGDERPRTTPSLADLYGPPISIDADDIFETDPKAQPAEQIFDKYLKALGGTLTSFTAKGTFQGYAEQDKSPVEVFAKAPNQRTTIIHRKVGDSTTVYDGRGAWSAAPSTEVPVTLLALSGSDLDALKVDAELTFPSNIKKMYMTWRVGFPSTIDDRDVLVVQGTSPGRSRIKLYFDKETGLLSRSVRYTDSPVGLNPTQTDYSDYREVAGAKVPFKWTTTWLDGRSTTELTELKPNVPIDASKFAKPAAPK